MDAAARLFRRAARPGHAAPRVTTHFISDLHLDESRPRATAAFLRFVAALRSDALYVLGDLFEAWLGDDDDAPLGVAVAAAFAMLAARGTRLHFQHGNRDFLIGSGFAGRAGIELLPESHVATIEGVPTLLLHGDTLCTGDVAYQQFRRQTRAPAWQAGFLAQPLAARRAFAAQARQRSAEHTANAPEALMDVAPDAVRDALRAAGVARLVHGHTHRPAIHAFDDDGRVCERIVLGDWYDQGSVLELDGDSVALKTIPVH